MNIKKLLTVLLSCLMMFVLAPNSTVGAEEKKDFTFYFNSFNEESLTIFKDGEMVKIYHNKLDNTIQILGDGFTDSYIIQPQWWPGNPNPQPGTQEWFQQNPSYGGNATSEQAKACAKEAFDSTFITEMSGSIAVWVSLGQFSLAAFGITFGVAYVITYANCLYRKGVR